MPQSAPNLSPSFIISSSSRRLVLMTVSTIMLMGSMPVRILGHGHYHCHSQSRRRLAAATAFISGGPARKQAPMKFDGAFVGRPRPSQESNRMMGRSLVSRIPTELRSSSRSSRLFATQQNHDAIRNWNTNSTDPRQQQQQQQPPSQSPRPATNSNIHNRNTNNPDHRNGPPIEQQQQQQRRPYSSSPPPKPWIVPKSIDIPVEKIDLSFVRASGAGGQNVNKVSSKVELRFDVMEADWLPLEVRERLYQQQRGRINKKGQLSLASQEHRTQEKNRKAALSRLHALLLEAWPRPVQRKMRTGVSKAAKKRKLEFKKRRSETKQGRKGVSDW